MPLLSDYHQESLLALSKTCENEPVPYLPHLMHKMLFSQLWKEIRFPFSYMISKSTPLIFSTATGNSLVLADVDAGSSPVQLTLTATQGTLTLSGTAGLTFATGDGTADSTLTMSGTLSALNAALEGLTFTPTANYTGIASVQVTRSEKNIDPSTTILIKIGSSYDGFTPFAP
ncbi:MAG: hypothetical protein JSR20_18125 [Nitrospira sp.]|nr:hypothetical protein [Nitrospira sp.]